MNLKLIKQKQKKCIEAEAFSILPLFAAQWSVFRIGSMWYKNVGKSLLSEVDDKAPLILEP